MALESFFVLHKKMHLERCLKLEYYSFPAVNCITLQPAFKQHSKLHYLVKAVLRVLLVGKNRLVPDSAACKINLASRQGIAARSPGKYIKMIYKMAGHLRGRWSAGIYRRPNVFNVGGIFCVARLGWAIPHDGKQCSDEILYKWKECFVF